MKCRRCRGSGKYKATRCWWCVGTGTTQAKKTLAAVRQDHLRYASRKLSTAASSCVIAGAPTLAARLYRYAALTERLADKLIPQAALERITEADIRKELKR